MTELESIDMCRPGWHHELWLIDSHLLLIGPGLWTMSIVLSVKLIHLRNILSDEHYKFETVSYYPYKKDSKCLQKFWTRILPNPISPSSVFTQILISPLLKVYAFPTVGSLPLSFFYPPEPYPISPLFYPYFTLIQNVSKPGFHPNSNFPYFPCVGLKPNTNWTKICLTNLNSIVDRVMVLLISDIRLVGSKNRLLQKPRTSDIWHQRPLRPLRDRERIVRRIHKVHVHMYLRRLGISARLCSKFNF